MARHDYIENDDGTLKTLNGDFVVGESDAQHIKDILESRPGDWKEFPTVGCSILDQMKGVPNQAFWKKVQKQLQAEGYDINDIDIQIGNE